jgi:hypothetical protein
MEYRSLHSNLRWIIDPYIPIYEGNHICGVVVSMFASNVVDREFKPKTIKLVFAASLLSTQQRLVGSESG